MPSDTGARLVDTKMLLRMKDATVTADRAEAAFTPEDKAVRGTCVPLKADLGNFQTSLGRVGSSN